jgi:DNA-binding NarL/FixJ family response regulator
MAIEQGDKNDQKKRVFLVDDHPLVRERLVQLIEREQDMMICGEADDAPPAFKAILETKPHIVVLDISLRRSHGLELIKNLQTPCPDVPILVFSMHEESLFALPALRAGASGYITKLEPTKEVLVAIRRVIEGQVYLSESMQQRIFQKQIGQRERAAFTSESLTDRELDVFHLLGRGFATRRIAEELHIGIKSVETYRARIKEKLGLKDATELLLHAIQRFHNLP